MLFVNLLNYITIQHGAKGRGALKVYVDSPVLSLVLFSCLSERDIFSMMLTIYDTRMLKYRFSNRIT